MLHAKKPSYLLLLLTYRRCAFLSGHSLLLPPLYDIPILLLYLTSTVFQCNLSRTACAEKMVNSLQLCLWNLWPSGANILCKHLYCNRHLWRSCGLSGCLSISNTGMQYIFLLYITVKNGNMI